MNVNFDINAMLKSVIEDFQNIARNVKISFKIRRLNEDNHRLTAKQIVIASEAWQSPGMETIILSTKGNPLPAFGQGVFLIMIQAGI